MSKISKIKILEQKDLEQMLKERRVNANLLSFVKEYFSLIAHSSGRIRLRASAKLLELKKDPRFYELDLKSILAIFKNIKALKETNFNALTGSLTIIYDAELFAPFLWEQWLKGENLQEIANAINSQIDSIKS